MHQTDRQRHAQPAAGASEREQESRDRAPTVELSDEQLLKAVATMRPAAYSQTRLLAACFDSKLLA